MSENDNGFTCNLCGGSGKITLPKPEETTFPSGIKVFAERRYSSEPKFILNEGLGGHTLNPCDVRADSSNQQPSKRKENAINGLLVLVRYSPDWEHKKIDFVGPFADQQSAEWWITEFNKTCKVGKAQLLKEEAITMPHPHQRAKEINSEAGEGDYSYPEEEE